MVEQNCVGEKGMEGVVSTGGCMTGVGCGAAVKAVQCGEGAVAWECGGCWVGVVGVKPVPVGSQCRVTSWFGMVWG